MARSRLTSRGRTVLVVLVVLALTVTVAAVVVLRSVLRDRCTVEVAGTSVALDRADAERITTAAADAIRRGTSVATAVDRVTGLSDDAAAVVTAAVSGRARAALTCTRGGADDDAPDDLSPAGLTSRAERVRRDVLDAFGDLPLGGFAPGGVSTGHMPGSAHYEGRALDIFFRPISARNKTRGWALAQYLVAHARRLEVATVIFDGQVWTARRGFQGWRDYTVSRENRSARTIRILEHRDHVHVDVAD